MHVPRPRYRLTTLLIAMTTIAVALWAVPAGQEFLSRRKFERAMRELRLTKCESVFGCLPDALWDGKTDIDLLNYPQLNPYGFQHFQHTDAHEFIPLMRGRSWYVIWSSGTPLRTISHPGPVIGWTCLWTSSRVYRLTPAPKMYQAQTKAVQRWVEESIEPRAKDPRAIYLSDFYQLVSGQDTSATGIHFQLIHSVSSEADD